MHLMKLSIISSIAFLLLPPLSLPNEFAEASAQLSYPLSVLHQNLNYTFYPDNSLLISDLETRERFKIDYQLSHGSGLLVSSLYSLNENEPYEKIITQFWKGDGYNIQLDYIFHSHKPLLDLKLQGETIEKLEFKVKLNNLGQYPFKYEEKNGFIYIGPFFYDITGLIEAGYSPKVDISAFGIEFEIQSERFYINPIATIGISHGLGNQLQINHGEKKIQLVTNGTSTFWNYTVGVWHLDEGQGSNVFDVSSVGMNNGFLGNSSLPPNDVHEPVWATGKFGGALSFDGVDDYVEIPASQTLEYEEDEPFSITLWIRPRSINNNFIFGYPDASAFLINFYLSTGIQVFSNRKTAVHIRYTPPLNEWSFVVVTYDGFMMKLFLLTPSASYGASNDKSSFGGTRASSSSLNIGGASRTPTSYFEGFIDEVRIYNRALTEEEIKFLSVAGTGIKFSDLKAGQKIEVYDTTSDLLVNGTVPNNETWVSLSQIFDRGGTNSIYFKVYDVNGSLIEETSTFKNVWCGSEFKIGYSTKSLRIIPEYWVMDRTSVIWLYNVSLTKASRIYFYAPKGNTVINVTFPDGTTFTKSSSNFSVTLYNSTHWKHELLFKAVNTTGCIKVYIKDPGYFLEIRREKLNIGTSIFSLIRIAILLAGIMIAYYLNKRYRFIEVHKIRQKNRSLGNKTEP